MGDIEIQDLRLLRAVADTGSLSGAARQLGTSQGNISRQLQRIERVTGLTLFQRHSRGAAPTQAGRMLLRGADTVLPLVDQLLLSAAEHAAEYDAERDGEYDGEHGGEGAGAPRTGRSLRLGAVPTTVLPALTSTLATLLPQTPLDLRLDESPEVLLGLLRGGRLDLAVLRHWPVLDAPLSGRVDTAVIAEERLHVGVAAQHPLARRPCVTLADLRDLSGQGPGIPVLAEAGHGALCRHLVVAAERHGIRLPVSCAADRTDATARACAMSAVLLGYHGPAPVPGIVHLPLNDDATRCLLLLAWPAGGGLARHGAELAALARETYG